MNCFSCSCEGYTVDLIMSLIPLPSTELGIYLYTDPKLLWLETPLFKNSKIRIQFSRSVMSDSLRPHELHHARPPCPSPTPGVYPNPRPSSWWCHPAISSCCPFFLLLPIPPSIRVFSNEPTLCMRWQKYWSFSFSIIPSKEHPGLISFRMDWLELLAVHGTLKSLLQYHSLKASILSKG